MSSAHPSDERAAAGTDPAATAATLRDAGFVRLVAAADGDALAATGLLASALGDVGVPFQTRVRTESRADPGADGAVVRVGGRTEGRVDAHLSRDAGPASVAAHAVARELGADPSPTLALAGAVAAGTTPGDDGTAVVLEAATRRGAVERRPGVAVPVTDVADGLAHSTLVRAPFSGDTDAARAALNVGEGTDATDADDERRRVASLVAVEAATAPEARPRAASAVERVLRPYATPDGPFETVGGHADVLRAVARERPGTGVALALGGRGDYDPRPAALDAWRTHGRAVHALLDGATTGRYDGLFVVRTDDAPLGRLRTAARIVAAYRSPEPLALVVSDGSAAATAAPDAAVDVRNPMDGAATAVGGDALGDGRRAAARFDGEVQAFIAAFREAMS
ncbi:MAG: exonuclease RecJ [Haloferacaceae archaeon]